MERMTKKNKEGRWFVPLTKEDGTFNSTQMVYDRLAAYEDTGLEPEDIAAPWVKLGETIYAILWSCGREQACACTVIKTINGIEWDSPRIRIREQSQGRALEFQMKDFGKILFKSKEEAEAQVERRRKNEH